MIPFLKLNCIILCIAGFEIMKRIYKEYEIQSYLKNIKKAEHRQTISKLRTSSHKLNIETGRYKKIDRSDRICKMCNCGTPETEEHFLLYCTSFFSVRNEFASKLESNNIDFSNMSVTDKLILLLNPPESIASDVGYYVHRMYKARLGKG